MRICDNNNSTPDSPTAKLTLNSDGNRQAYWDVDKSNYVKANRYIVKSIIEM